MTTEPNAQSIQAAILKAIEQLRVAKPSRIIGFLRESGTDINGSGVRKALGDMEHAGVLYRYGSNYMRPENASEYKEQSIALLHQSRRKFEKVSNGAARYAAIMSSLENIGDPGLPDRAAS